MNLSQIEAELKIKIDGTTYLNDKNWTHSDSENLLQWLRSKITELLGSTKLENSQGRQIRMPCPDNQPGCLVLHYSSESYLQDWDTGFNQAVSDQATKIQEALK
jgi:hypothetical protein